jgi:pyruvate/2-oxoglutarate/acetoin dehydrogenase E1 component
MTTVLESLNSALHGLLAANRSVVVLGEDILDPYGGAFKVTRGLSSRFPERVLTTPISEAALVGLAGGMALRGWRPIVEIMFGDFVTLAADPLVNAVSKYQWMYRLSNPLHVVVRLPSGGYRGYGPTHSQCLEKMFVGVPGLEVIAVNTVTDPAHLLRHAVIGDVGPCLFVEHKLLYSRTVREFVDGRLGQFFARSDGDPFPTVALSLLPFSRADATLVCASYMVELGLEAVTRLLMDEELVVELIAVTRLRPRQLGLMGESIDRSRRLATLEEGTLTGGWGAEVIAQAMDLFGATHPFRAGRIAARDIPIGSSPALENNILPSTERICTAIRSLIKIPVE